MNHSAATFNKVQIVCPSNVVTGGPESLHNLANLLGSLGCRVSIVYFPYASNHTVPKPYVKYGVRVEALDDSPDVLVIFPETLCMSALRLRFAKACIWWLSVDSFLEIRDRDYKDALRYFRRAIKRKRPFRGIKALAPLTHFSKCFYDEEYLRLNNISFSRLSGPISKSYINFSLSKDSNNLSKNNIILYNPKKNPISLISKLKAYTGYAFKALHDLDESGLMSVFSSSKLYVDFGNHPGLERMPREAAVCGCCIITGRKGSAANPYDINIPDFYKLSESDPNFLKNFKSVVDYIFESYEVSTNDFIPFRNSILESHDSQKNECIFLINKFGIKCY